MTLESIRAFCLSLPHTDEKEAWDVHILFRVADKMFCISTLEPTNDSKLSFKCSPEDFAELIERENIVPAPYMARNNWVSLLEWDALPASELKQYLRRSYDLIVSKLPKKTQAQITGTSPEPAARKRSARTKK